MAATIGTGATITFETGYLAELVSIGINGASRSSIPTSHMGTTGGMTFTPSTLYDPGGVSAEILMVPATSPLGPLTAAAGNITVTFPDAGNATLAASGYMEGFDVTIPLEDRITQTVTLKFSGNITYTP